MTSTENLNKQEEFIFTYKGIDYDATDYVKKHPGGPEFISNMKKERKDIT